MIRILLSSVLLAVMAACTPGPQPLHLGSQECDHCRMLIADPRFAAQAVTTKGKAYTFDTVDCLVDWLRSREPSAETLHSVWVADFDQSERWIPAADAAFVRSDRASGPMGAGLSAHATAELADAYLERVGGERLAWHQVRLVAGHQALDEIVHLHTVH